MAELFLSFPAVLLSYLGQLKRRCFSGAHVYSWSALVQLILQNDALTQKQEHCVL